MSIEPPHEDDSAVRSAPYTLEQTLSGVVMGLIVLISFGNVLARYFTSQSFAATEEFSIALLIVLSFVGSSAAFAFDRHIRVSFFADKLPPAGRAALEWLSFAVTASLFAFIAFHAGVLTWDQYRFEETSPALGVPQWWYTVWMPVLAVALVVRLILTRWRGAGMIGTVLIVLFLAALVAGMPLAVALGVASVTVLAMAGFDQLAVPTNIYAGIAKYPLLAIPMFILAGMIFERSGVAIRLVRFVTAMVGEWTGSLAVVAVLVSMLLGGISGSGPADAAAVAAVMLPSMIARGYPKGFSAGLIAAAGSTAIVIPPSVAFIVYSVMVPAATVPALFAAGLFPGMIAALCLLVPAIIISRKYGFGRDFKAERPPLGKSLIDAVWGLLAPVIILGGLRTGLFTPTEAAVVAVAYGIFVGMVVYRSISFRDLFRVLVDAGELSAVVLMIIGIASVFAWAGNTLGIFDAAAKALVGLHSSEWLMLLSINLLLLAAGMFLDAISIFLILLPLLVPIAIAMGWDLVWFGVMMTINLAIGQFTPPMAISLMITSRIAGIGMEETFKWVVWLVLAMGAGLALMIVFPQLALWLPGKLGYL